jgi:WD40 repeat protein
VQTLQPPTMTYRLSGGFSPDNGLLVIADYGAPTRIYDTKTWRVVRQLPITAFAAAFSPDGKYLAAGNGWDIDLWRVADLVAP